MQGRQTVLSAAGRPMIRSRNDQRGMTTLGFIILAAFVGLFAFAAIRLTPKLSAGPYVAALVPFGTGSVDRARVRGSFAPGASVLLGLRLSLGL